MHEYAPEVHQTRPDVLGKLRRILKIESGKRMGEASAGWRQGTRKTNTISEVRRRVSVQQLSDRGAVHYGYCARATGLGKERRSNRGPSPSHACPPKVTRSDGPHTRRTSPWSLSSPSNRRSPRIPCGTGSPSTSRLSHVIAQDRGRAMLRSAGASSARQRRRRSADWTEQQDRSSSTTLVPFSVLGLGSPLLVSNYQHLAFGSSPTANPKKSGS